MTKEELLDQIVYCYTRMWGTEFNVFHWIALENEEVDHSILIKSLLNREGIHNCKDSFLKLFLEQVAKDFEFDSRLEQKDVNMVRQFLFEFPTAYSSAVKECPATLSNESKQETKKGRMDIYINSSKIKNKAIIIENKLNADDQKQQIVRYDEWASGKEDNQGKMEKDDYLIIYLTKTGHEAKEISCIPTGKTAPIRYICISYRDTIITWLNACIKYLDDQRKDESLMRLKMSIKQYREYLERIVVREEILKKAISNYIEANGKRSKDDFLKYLNDNLDNNSDIRTKIKKDEIIYNIKNDINTWFQSASITKI